MECRCWSGQRLGESCDQGRQSGIFAPRSLGCGGRGFVFSLGSGSRPARGYEHAFRPQHVFSARLCTVASGWPAHWATILGPARGPAIQRQHDHANARECAEWGAPGLSRSNLSGARLSGPGLSRPGLYGAEQSSARLSRLWGSRLRTSGPSGRLAESAPQCSRAGPGADAAQRSQL